MSATTARRVHDDLVCALDRLRRAEHSAVILFARVLDEGLHRTLGHATIELYGTEGLGLSLGKTRQFIRLARALDDLPSTRAALDDGRLSWTKARTIAAVATPRTEERWITTAAQATSRELETRVRRTRERNRKERDRRRRHRGQAAMVLGAPVPAARITESPVTVSTTFTPVQHARYERLLEQLRKKGRNATRAELLLEGLAALADGANTRELSASPYHIVAYRCEACNATTVDGRPVAAATAAAMACDAVAMSRDPLVPNHAAIPPSVRRAVLARDHHRCTTSGCGAARFLEVHHITPRSAGGSNRAENLTTLCGACHRFVHQLESEGPGPQGTGPSSCAGGGRGQKFSTTPRE